MTDRRSATLGRDAPITKANLQSYNFANHGFVRVPGEARGHLDLLAAELGRLVNAPIAFGDWNEALSSLGEQAKLQPLVVVLDEFQWMLLAEPTLDSIVMRHFDRRERARVPITLVVSGSALTMMEQLLEGDRAMFGRSGYRPFLQPFDYRDYAERLHVQIRILVPAYAAVRRPINSGPGLPARLLAGLTAPGAHQALSIGRRRRGWFCIEVGYQLGWRDHQPKSIGPAS